MLTLSTYWGAITRLEMVLQSKLALFEDCLAQEKESMRD